MRCSLDRCCRNYVAPVFYIWRAHQHSPASQLVCHPVLAVCVYVNSLSLRMWEERAAKSSKVEKRLSIVPLCHLYSFPIVYMCWALAGLCVLCRSPKRVRRRREQETDGLTIRAELLSTLWCPRLDPSLSGDPESHHTVAYSKGRPAAAYFLFLASSSSSSL